MLALPNASPQGSAQFVIVHVGFAFADAPQPSHFIWVFDDKLSIVPLPGDDVLIFLLLQQLQNEMPQLDLTGTWA